MQRTTAPPTNDHEYKSKQQSVDAASLPRLTCPVIAIAAATFTGHGDAEMVEGLYNDCVEKIGSEFVAKITQMGEKVTGMYEGGRDEHGAAARPALQGVQERRRCCRGWRSSRAVTPNEEGPCSRSSVHGGAE